jgi:hypothetical protein
MPEEAGDWPRTMEEFMGAALVHFAVRSLSLASGGK